MPVNSSGTVYGLFTGWSDCKGSASLLWWDAKQGLDDGSESRMQEWRGINLKNANQTRLFLPCNWLECFHSRKLAVRKNKNKTKT